MESIERRERREKRQPRFNRKQLWLSIGAIVLIVLLIVWLTIADLWGDTDVSAILPMVAQ